MIMTYKIIYANGYIVECKTQRALKKELRVCMKTINNMFTRGTAVFKDLDVLEIQKYYNQTLIGRVTNSERAKIQREQQEDENYQDF